MWYDKYRLRPFASTREPVNTYGGVDLFNAASIHETSKNHADTLQTLFEEFARIRSASFGVECDTMQVRIIRANFLKVDTLAIWHDGHQPLGFASMLHYPKLDVTYVQSVFIGSKSKRLGGSTALANAIVSSAQHTKYLAFTTQNPVVYCVAHKVCERKSMSIFPNLKRTIVPQHLHAIGAQIVARFGGVLDPDTFIVHERYKGCLYPTLPQSTDSQVNEWFERSLNPVDGRTRDSFLFLATASP
jgi:hypothetical protein